MTSTGPRERRTAIVTGGARGIGAGIARRLSQDGLKVAIMDLDAEGSQVLAAVLSPDGRDAIGLGVDVSDESAVTEAVDRVAQELGEPQVLVNNAGIIRDNALFKMSLDDWERVMAVHLTGSFLMSRAVQGFMTRAGWGRIVNLSSTSALGNRGQANYSAAKAGLQGFTKTLAIELGKFGVTSNAIAPGFIETEMTVATATRLGMGFQELKEQAAAGIPVRRTGTPDDIANAVSFFVDERSGFVSGQVLYVAGGPLC